MVSAYILDFSTQNIVMICLPLERAPKAILCLGFREYVLAENVPFIKVNFAQVIKT